MGLYEILNCKGAEENAARKTLRTLPARTLAVVDAILEQLFG
jgi:hypothetical protein